MCCDQLFTRVCGLRPFEAGCAVKVRVHFVVGALVFEAYHRTKCGEMSQHATLQRWAIVGHFFSNLVDLAFVWSIIESLRLQTEFLAVLYRRDWRDYDLRPPALLEGDFGLAVELAGCSVHKAALVLQVVDLACFAVRIVARDPE